MSFDFSHGWQVKMEGAVTPSTQTLSDSPSSAFGALFGGPIPDADDPGSGWKKSYVVEQNGEVVTGDAAYNRIRQTRLGSQVDLALVR